MVENAAVSMIRLIKEFLAHSIIPSLKPYIGGTSSVAFLSTRYFVFHIFYFVSLPTTDFLLFVFFWQRN